MTDERKTKAGLTERAHHAGDGKPAAREARGLHVIDNGAHLPRLRRTQ